MLELHLSDRIFSSSTPLSSLLPTSDVDEKLHVVLSNNETFPIISSFWNLIFNDKRLRILSLIDLQLNENDAALLSQYLSEQHRLMKLTFDSVRGTPEIFHRILHEGLQKNSTVKHLTLINLEHLDTTILSHLIEQNKSIEYLCLRENRISANDMILIANALRVNSKLKAIDLSDNSIGEGRSVDIGGSISTATLQSYRYQSD